MDRLISMQAFVKAVEMGSLTAAATALALSPQMVGIHLGSLEDWLGTPLLRRTTRRQSLTDAGQIFYARCRVILAETEAAEALTRDFGAKPRGRLRISAPVDYGARRVAPFVARFLDEFPEVQVELSLTDRYVGLGDEGYDAVFRLGPLGDGTLWSRVLEPQRQVACASPAYLKARGSPLRPEHLTDHECLDCINVTGNPYAEWSFTKDGTVNVIAVRSRFQVDDGRVLVAAAIAGHGVILQPWAAVEDEIARGRLRRLLPDYQAPERSLHLLTAGGRQPVPKLHVFVDRAVAELGPRPEARQDPA